MSPIKASSVASITPLSTGNSNVVTKNVSALNNYIRNTMMTDTGIYSGYMTETQKMIPIRIQTCSMKLLSQLAFILKP